MSKSVKKLVEETKDQGYTELDLCDKSLSTIADIPGLSKCFVLSLRNRYFFINNDVQWSSSKGFFSCAFPDFEFRVIVYLSLFFLFYSPAEAFGTPYFES